MTLNKRFIGTFGCYTFAPTFRMMFLHSSGFKRSIKEVGDNYRSFEPWRWREVNPKCWLKSIKREGFDIFSFYLFFDRFNPQFYLQEKTSNKLILIFFHARMSALIDISHQFGVSSGYNRLIEEKVKIWRLGLLWF